MIKVNQLDKTFNKYQKNKIHVINDISLEFPEKGLVVLLGKSGSGKTTLLNVIGGLDKVDKGDINFYGKEIKKYNANVWDSLRREDIGFIFQNYYLKNDLSVFDNVAFVLKLIGIHDEQAIEERVNYILTQVGMYKYRKKLASQLSGGQQQRVAIARALVKNPKVIIADEPTGNLDSNNTIEIMNIIKNISVNKLVVLVTHEKNIADFYGDRIIEITDGKVVNDYQNDSKDDHDFINDNAIYLKDLNKVSHFKDDKLVADFYSDSEEVEPTKVKFIIKNKTLYIDVDSSISKIKLNDETLNLQIKDEKFKKKTREEMLETTFDLEKLSHENLHKSNKLNVSFKTSLWIAFKKFLRYGKKGKLMLFLFAVSGIFIAYSVINNYTILTENTDKRLTLSEDFVSVSSKSTSSQNNQLFNDIVSIEGTDLIFGIQTSLYYDFILPNSSSSTVRLVGSSIENYQASKGKILIGRTPTNRTEVVISLGMYKQNTINDLDFTGIGIWKPENLLNQKIRSGDSYQYTIVGITNEYKKTFYTYDNQAIVEFGLNQKSPTSLTNKQVFDILVESSYKIYFSSVSPKLAVDTLIDKGYEADLVVKALQEQLSQDKQSKFIENMVVSIVFVVIALVVFYFVMRSSMISRIYEIAVNRALGVKKSELMLSFVAEIVLIITVSTLIGFLGTVFVMDALSSSTIGAFVSYKIDIFALLIGIAIVYGINLIVGLLPLFTLLRKTPSQIISTYDM